MKLILTSKLKSPFNQFFALFSIIILLNACTVEKKYDQILKHSTHDTLTKSVNSSPIKNIGKLKKMEHDGVIFDQYISNDFQFPKKKKDSTAIINYFVEESFAQLGRREFKQCDVVVIRGVLFQINLKKNSIPERSRTHNQSRIEFIGMIFVLLGFYFF
ncbi:hypothetical protein [Pedobacter boryungensis]|uniref:Lipoprotein n=1 Tax=Pedobacter boryungensis TaxID=869962 RepID=A0ABX2DDJ3_9SPHI|nr:hypothetical protein [Pedobacter boryungensis]NQX31614.1 hypothetical protein [Pedobacter boryungensis]